MVARLVTIILTCSNPISALASGLEGVTVVDAWDSAGVREEHFVAPIEISMALVVSSTVPQGSTCRRYLAFGFATIGT